MRSSNMLALALLVAELPVAENALDHRHRRLCSCLNVYYRLYINTLINLLTGSLETLGV